MHGSFRKFIKESIHESQKCQRNWDLTQEMPQEDIDLILEAATNAPSKQNLNLFKLHVIQDRDLIEEVGIELADDFLKAHNQMRDNKDNPAYDKLNEIHDEMQKEVKDEQVSSLRVSTKRG